MGTIVSLDERRRTRQPAVITVDALDELRIELATSKSERLAHTDSVRDLVRLAMAVLARGGSPATHLERLDRRNEREALRARSIDLTLDETSCACGKAA